MSGFFEQFLPGMLAEASGAILFYLIVENRIKKVEQRDAERVANEKKNQREKERVEFKRWEQEKRHTLVHATMLQQFPPIIQRLIDIQRDAFQDSLIRFTPHENHHGLINLIINNLRHYANVHLDTADTLRHLGVDVKQAKLHADLTNALALLSIELVRERVDPSNCLYHISNLLPAIRAAVKPEWGCASHVRRIDFHLENIEYNSNYFQQMKEIEQKEFLCSVAEAVGHNTNLYIEHVNHYFSQAVQHILEHDHTSPELCPLEQNVLLV